VPLSIEDADYSHPTNVNGTLNVLQAARKAGVKRLVLRRVIFGPWKPARAAARRDDTTNSGLPYAVQKLTGEYYLGSYYEVYGLEAVSLRYFNIFGPRQDPSSPYSGVLARYIQQILAGERPTIFGDGKQGGILLASATSSQPTCWPARLRQRRLPANCSMPAAVSRSPSTEPISSRRI
jgi:UDP-glucose 4-epimerase